MEVKNDFSGSAGDLFFPSGTQLACQSITEKTIALTAYTLKKRLRFNNYCNFALEVSGKIDNTDYSMYLQLKKNGLTLIGSYEFNTLAYDVATFNITAFTPLDFIDFNVKVSDVLATGTLGVVSVLMQWYPDIEKELD